MDDKTTKLGNDAIEMLKLIANKEPEAAQALSEAIIHIGKTYSDKYQAGGSTIDTKQDLYDKRHGNHINIYQTKRYLQRYDTAGFRKSSNPVDLYKGIHYVIFELTRRIIHKMDSNNDELTDTK